MQVNDTVKIKNPQLNFQKELRHTLTKVNKTTVWCYENSYPKHIYKGVRRSTITKVD